MIPGMARRSGLLLALPFLLFPAIPSRAGEGAVRKLQVEGFDHPVLVCVPEGYTPKKAWGLVLCLHGTGMNGGHMLQGFSDCGRLAAMGKAGYLVAFPSSNHQAWGTGPSGGEEIKSRELKLLRTTVEALLKEYRIDEHCVHTFGFSCGTILLALGAGFRDEWDGLKIRSICGNSGGLDGKVMPAKAARAKETAVWILNGEQDTDHDDISRNIHEAFRLGGYEARYTMAWGIDHGFPLAPVSEMLTWWRQLDGDRLKHHPAPAKGPEGFEVAMVPPGSPAERARLQVGDRILSADGRPLNTSEEVSRELCGRKRGEKVRLRLKRGKTEFEAVLAY